MKNKRTLAYIALITTAIIWGAALPVVKPALTYVTSYQFLFLRYLIAAPLAAPLLLYLLYKFRPSLKTILIITGLEILQLPIGLTLLYEGLKHTTSLQAAFIATASPIFTTIGGVIFLKEREERHELVGLALSFIGISLLTLEPLLLGKAKPEGISFFGNTLVMAYNLSWTAYVLLGKKYYQNVNKLLIGSVSLWVGLISFFVISLLTSHFSIDLIQTTLFTPSVLLATAYMGILGSIIAVPAIIYGHSLIEASEASLFTYLQPVAYLPLSIFWLKEPFHPLMFVAFLLILLGVFVAEKRLKRRRQSTS